MGRSRFLNVKLNIKVPSLGECFCNTSAKEEKDLNHEAIGKALGTLRNIRKPEPQNIDQETDSDHGSSSKQIVVRDEPISASDAKLMAKDIEFLKSSIMQHKSALQKAKMENQYLKMLASSQKEALSKMVTLAALDKHIESSNQTVLELQHQSLMERIEESPVSPAIPAALQITGGSVVVTSDI